ncbi:hypothetical protein F5Y18DRAFT_381915 [Xylariaceae sp. FL1019]|nr:hypothetical protein F5Y18DRAFT_381915 [Xylariaceae sp. FL1019]
MKVPMHPMRLCRFRLNPRPSIALPREIIIKVVDEEASKQPTTLGVQKNGISEAQISNRVATDWRDTIEIVGSSIFQLHSIKLSDAHYLDSISVSRNTLAFQLITISANLIFTFEKSSTHQLSLPAPAAHCKSTSKMQLYALIASFAIYAAAVAWLSYTKLSR